MASGGRDEKWQPHKGREYEAAATELVDLEEFYAYMAEEEYEAEVTTTPPVVVTSATSARFPAGDGGSDRRGVASTNVVPSQAAALSAARRLAGVVDVLSPDVGKGAGTEVLRSAVLVSGSLASLIVLAWWSGTLPESAAILCLGALVVASSVAPARLSPVISVESETDTKHPEVSVDEVAPSVATPPPPKEEAAESSEDGTVTVVGDLNELTQDGSHLDGLDASATQHGIDLRQLHAWMDEQENQTKASTVERARVRDVAFLMTLAPVMGSVVVLRLEVGKDIVVGRSPEGKRRVVLDGPLVSKSHFRIKRKAEGYILSNLGGNGTFINGSTLRSEFMLRSGDQITVPRRDTKGGGATHSFAFVCHAGGRPGPLVDFTALRRELATILPSVSTIRMILSDAHLSPAIIPEGAASEVWASVLERLRRRRDGRGLMELLRAIEDEGYRSEIVHAARMRLSGSEAGDTLGNLDDDPPH